MVSHSTFNTLYTGSRVTLLRKWQNSPEELSTLADMAPVPLNAIDWKLIFGVSNSIKSTHSQYRSSGEMESAYRCIRLLVVPMMKSFGTSPTEQNFISMHVNFSLMVIEVLNKMQALSKNFAQSCLILSFPSLVAHSIRDGTPDTIEIVKTSKQDLCDFQRRLYLELIG